MERYRRRGVCNECYTALRVRRRDRAAVTDAAILEAVAASDHGPDERITLDHAIRLLPAEQREVIHLKVFEGWTFQEIAAICDDSINTVASRYRYAIEQMRGVLGARS